MASIEKRGSDKGITYRVKVRLKGYPTQTATFARLTDAKKWAQHTEAAIREGRHFKTAEAKKHTLAELIDRYIAQVLPQKPKSYKKQKMQLEWWKKRIGHSLLSGITPALISEQRDFLLNEPSKLHKDKLTAPATVVRYLAALSHALSVAADEWGWIESSPMRKVRKPKEPRGRVRFLSDDERVALLEACKESPYSQLYTIVVLALSTGMRKSEIMNLTWNDVNLEEGSLILHETKNDERRKVPVKGAGLELVKELSKYRRIDTKLLFPSTSRNAKTPFEVRKPWVDALVKAEIEDFRFHDLRHSAASYLAMNGASIAEIAEVLGHKTLQMVKRYAHLSESHTAGVVERMNKRIFG